MESMPFTLNEAGHTGIQSAHGFCNVNATAAVEEFWRKFPTRNIPDRCVLFLFIGSCEKEGHSSMSHGQPKLL
jgi:hypothetical protein